MLLMELVHNRNDTYRGCGAGRPETVSSPPIHEGIGNALRCAYQRGEQSLPAEFAGLLDKLR